MIKNRGFPVFLLQLECLLWRRFKIFKSKIGLSIWQNSHRLIVVSFLLWSTKEIQFQDLVDKSVSDYRTSAHADILEPCILHSEMKYLKGQRVLCPCSAVGVGQKSLRLICLIATILAVTTRLGQPLAGSDDFVSSLSEKAQLIGTVCVCVCVCVCSSQK